jgi:hypothetical protein
MVKINKSFLVTLIFIINILFFINTNVTYSSDDETQYLLGKVVYSDDKTPVTEGWIKIISYTDSDNNKRIEETAMIQYNGVFRFKNSSVIAHDHIKIMAYPNDVDNLPDAPFEPASMEIKKATINTENEYAILVEVQRNINKKKNLSKKQNAKVLLNQNYPNPFNPTTLINFELSEPSNVTLVVYNMIGEKVTTLVDNMNFKKGINKVEFNAGMLPSGIYIYTLTAGSLIENKKMILIK